VAFAVRTPEYVTLSVLILEPEKEEAVTSPVTFKDPLLLNVNVVSDM